MEFIQRMRESQNQRSGNLTFIIILGQVFQRQTNLLSVFRGPCPTPRSIRESIPIETDVNICPVYVKRIGSTRNQGRTEGSRK